MDLKRPRTVFFSPLTVKNEVGAFICRQLLCAQLKHHSEVLVVRTNHESIHIRVEPCEKEPFLINKDFVAEWNKAGTYLKRGGKTVPAWRSDCSARSSACTCRSYVRVQRKFRFRFQQNLPTGRIRMESLTWRWWPSLWSSAQSQHVAAPLEAHLGSCSCASGSTGTWKPPPPGTISPWTARSKVRSRQSNVSLNFSFEQQWNYKHGGLTCMTHSTSLF